MKILLFSICIFFIGQISSAQSKSFYDSLEARRYVTQVENRIKQIDNKSITLKKETKNIRYSENSNKFTKATIFLNNGTLSKLLYYSYNDNYTLADGREIFYFDTIGNIICHVTSTPDLFIHTIFYNNYVFSYNKIKGQISSIANQKDFVSTYIHAQTKFVLDYYLSNFDSIQYNTFNIYNNNSTILRIKKTLDLYKLPDINSLKIISLNVGDELIYIDRSNKQEAILDKEPWIWYKIKTIKGLIGWLWGSPKFIKEYY